MSGEPQGSAAVPELLRRRSIDVLLIALLLGVAAVVVIWLLDVPGTRVWIFVATALAIVLYLALAYTRLRTVRRHVGERLSDLPAEAAVVALTDTIPVFRSPALVVQRRPDGLWFVLASDPAQSAMLAWDAIRRVDVTRSPRAILLTLVDGGQLRLGVLTPRLSATPVTELEKLRRWMTKKGSSFPAGLGAATFAPARVLPAE